jgi:dTMP kinase
MGLFITLEGGEGCGKSTLAAGLEARLREAGLEVVRTREPGGSPLAERMRNLLLAGAFRNAGTESVPVSQVEAVCFALARSDHVSKVVAPALARGAVVICDRFFDSTRAYQGAAGHAVPGFLDELEREACGDVRPDLTFVLDCPVGVAHGRASARRGAQAADRFESEAQAFHEAVRSGFLEIVRNQPGRCRLLDASLPPDDVLASAWDHVAERLPAAPQAGAR